MKSMMDHEAETQVPSQEIDNLKPALLNKVIPRLLRPLQEADDPIEPCLVHGDLWHGNTSVSVDTGAPYAFDSCVL
jgi:protein-ribulosamine 3-kinase